MHAYACICSSRVRGKQREADVSMVYRRNSKYCQAPDCVFNRSTPGQPARSSETKCVWCDPDAMSRAIAAGGAALMHVRVSLSIFEEKNLLGTLSETTQPKERPQCAVCVHECVYSAYQAVIRTPHLCFVK